MKISAIITAGGTSSRFGNTNKLLEKINGKEIIQYTVDAFLDAEIAEIIICANCSIIENLSEMFKNNPNIKIIEGGKTRQESVYKGLQAANCDYVLIHDGARPMITDEIIKNTIAKVQNKNFTDDAGMIEALGFDVYIVEGDYRNIKVTTKSDIALASNYLNEI